MLLLLPLRHSGRDVVGGLRYAPRPLDLDIIFYGSQDVQHEALHIPHIRLVRLPGHLMPLRDCWTGRQTILWVARNAKQFTATVNTTIHSCWRVVAWLG
jgi:7,8-dihydro-6-hydroxymethylpterin-pyrophosphokinase